jgi:hypothetical protein
VSGVSADGDPVEKAMSDHGCFPMQESTAQTLGRLVDHDTQHAITPVDRSPWWQSPYKQARSPIPPNDELRVLLDELGRRRFLMHSFRADQHGPEWVAAVRDFGGRADVFLLLDAQRACAFRTPTGLDIDVLAPRAVFWWYMATPVWTLRALLTLDPPDHPQAPHRLVEVPPGLGLPIDDRSPVQIRGRNWGGSA